MRRLMANDVAYGVVLLLFVAAIVAWVYWPKPQRTVVHEQTRTGPTLVIQTPPLTPLQARRAKRTSAARSPDSATTTRVGSSGDRANSTPVSVGKPLRPQKRSPSPAKRKTPARKAPASPTHQSPPSAPPSTTQPPPAVTVPLPSVCLPPVKVGDCP